MTRVMMMAFDGLLFWIVLRCSAALAVVVFAALEDWFSWLLDPFFEWIRTVAGKAIPGTTVELDELHRRMKPRTKAFQLWGWGHRNWLIGIARSIR